MSKVIKHIVGRDLIEFENGEFRMVGIPGMLVPHQSVFALNAEFAKAGILEQVKKIYHGAGVAQGSVATVWLIKKAGAKMPKTELVKRMLEDTRIMGLGVLELVSLKDETATVSWTGGILDSYFKVTSSTDFYIIELVQGMVEGVFRVILKKATTSTVTHRSGKVSIKVQFGEDISDEIERSLKSLIQ